MRTAPDFNHTCVRLDRLKRLENVAHASRRLNHRADDLFFAPAQVFRLAFLVRKLARQGPLRKPMTSLFSETHLLLLLCAFCASLWLKRLYFETDIRGGCGICERFDANQLRTGFGILAHVLRRDLSITLDRDRARQLAPDRREGRKLLRAEILDHEHVSTGVYRFTNFILTRNLHRDFVQITEL